MKKVDRKPSNKFVVFVEENKTGVVHKKGKYALSSYYPRRIVLDKHTLRIYDDEDDDGDAEEIFLKAYEIKSLDNQSKGKPGFSLIKKEGLGGSHHFITETIEVRNSWVDWISKGILESVDESLWRKFSSNGNFDTSKLQWVESDDANSDSNSEKTEKKNKLKNRKTKTRRKRPHHAEIILQYKILTSTIKEGDAFLCSDRNIHIYLPVFLQVPSIITDVYDLITEVKNASTFAFMYKFAGLAIAPLYIDSKDFWDFEETEALNRTYEKFDELAEQFPLVVDAEYTYDEGLVDIVFNKSSRINKLTVKKVFASGHKPCLIEMSYEDETIEPSRIVFKKDDCRPDMMVETMFEVFNRIWKNAGIIDKTYLITFKVIPGGKNWGILEFVSNSCSLRDYSLSKIQEFDEEQLDVFLSTASAGYVGAFILGIRDRHKDNLMIKDDFYFFQLDFKHAFNFKTFGIDSCRFAIPTGFKKKLENRGVWDNFKNRCVLAHMVLRRQAEYIVMLARHLFNGLFDREPLEEALIKAFYLDRTEEQAAAQIKKLIESGVHSMKRVMKNVTHELSGNIKQ